LSEGNKKALMIFSIIFITFFTLFLVFNNINKFNKAIDLLEDNNELVDANNDLANGDNNVLIKGTNYTTGLSGVDPSTEVIEFIDHEHHEIHEGNSFRSFSNKDVSNSGDYNIAFKTPAGSKWIHLTFTVDHELESDLKLYENVTSWTGGTPILPVNSNRNYDTLSTITNISYDITAVMGTPNLLLHEVGGSGKKFGGSATHLNEWVLKSNMTYYMLLENQGAGTNEVNIQLDWYEHTDKN